MHLDDNSLNRKSLNSEYNFKYEGKQKLIYVLSNCQWHETPPDEACHALHFLVANCSSFSDGGIEGGDLF